MNRFLIYQAGGMNATALSFLAEMGESGIGK